MSLIKINTRDFSEVEISDDMIMKFPEGVFAFEEYKEFVLLSLLFSRKRYLVVRDIIYLM